MSRLYASPLPKSNTIRITDERSSLCFKKETSSILAPLTFRGLNIKDNSVENLSLTKKSKIVYTAVYLRKSGWDKQ
jgi:hypothetical protein